MAAKKKVVKKKTKAKSKKEGKKPKVCEFC